jgi:hypothetical protein
VSDDAYQQDEGDLVAPPTFPACFTVLRGAESLFGDDELGAHLNLLHASQEYEFHRPVRLGDVLDCIPQITDIASRRGNDFLTLETRCVDAGTNEPVLMSRGTLVFLGTRD